MGCTTYDLREKDVVNMCDGKKLGCVAELEIDPECGRVTAIIVSPDTISAIVFSKHQIRIPWDKIIRIGHDIILVDAPPPPPKCDECVADPKDKCKRKWWKF